ncbi:MAG TPA: hypothetical protein VNH22_09460 [Blastocatellia bacterium]|jgi:hypothetical protein|nr:hypothetical protein [Blastocatellia bacterium]
MAEMTSSARVSIGRLILIPAVISLAVTVIRLIGELQHWSEWWFSPKAGGGASPIGISWLVPIFGVYFAQKLARAGEGPAGNWRAVLFSLLGIALMFAGGFLGFAPTPVFPGKLIIGLLLIIASAAVQFSGWSSLAKTLLAYGYAVRIPVAILMFFAIRGQWGTHYDVLPPGFPSDLGFWTTYFQIAFLPQMLLWIAFTINVGALFGSVANVMVSRRMPSTQAAAG